MRDSGYPDTPGRAARLLAERVDDTERCLERCREAIASAREALSEGTLDNKRRIKRALFYLGCAQFPCGEWPGRRDDD